MEKNFDAHISEDRLRRQSVAEHCKNVAELAAAFAAHFGAEDCGRAAGLWHDIGKYSEAFQARIHNPEHTHRVDHSTAGAQQAWRAGLRPIAFCVAGHHTGLPDGGSPKDAPGSATLFSRMAQQNLPDYSAWANELALPKATLPAYCQTDPFSLSFFIRMLYSCLVDADYLDTEAFMQNTPIPRGEGASLVALHSKVQAKANSWLSAPKKTPLNEKRCAILQACITAGQNAAPGLFTMTVPTGGSKTFSSLAFAMEHAIKTGKRRIVYVIPYTSIIDQTVSTFEDILGAENVLAHHGSTEYMTKPREDLTPEEYRRLLASENWDAPVIVTTAVQFFESLYANKSSRCRKLHNLADSVVIFDEAQTLPTPYLYPCIAAISQLVRHYNVSAVLCTATQPELGPIFAQKGFAPDFPMQEIVPNSAALYDTFRRITLKDAGCLPQETLTAHLAAQTQVLCIVNRRATAQQLYSALPQAGAYCLTTLLTPQDRKAQLKEIRALLKDGKPCRVVSTSLIEAGVDVDFPTVYREITGLDSILQAAGRCNREGLHPAAESLVFTFTLENSAPPPMLGQAIAALHNVQRRFPDLTSPQAIAAYFTALRTIGGEKALDKEEILDAFERGHEGCVLPFAWAATKFSLIDTPTRTIYLPLDGGAALCERLRAGFFSRTLLRQLGPYSVSVYEKHFEVLDRMGALELVDEDCAILRDTTYYNRHTGLKLDMESGQGFFC